MAGTETVDDIETTIKVIVVGNGQVGKTSMTTRYCKGYFTDNYKKTIGVDFMEKTIDVEDSTDSVRMMVWDTAGQEEFDALTSRYYKGAGACALVFSTVDRASFDAIASWKRKVEEECDSIPMCLVQNKVDLIDEAVVTPVEVEDLARKLKLKLYRSCVKDNVNVTEIFEYLAAQYIVRGKRIEAVQDITDFGEEEKGGDAAPAKTSAKGSSASGGAASKSDTFKLDDNSGPSKRRTGGKKSKLPCTIL